MNLLLNIVWFLLIGWELALALAVIGIVLLCTIIGIPFAIRVFNVIPVVLFPFGRKPSA